MPTPTLTRVLDCLSIVHGQLDVESAKALSRALERNASLTRLNLDGLELDLDHLRGVGDEPPARLDFSYQGISDVSGVVIAGLLETNEKLTSLNLGYNLRLGRKVPMIATDCHGWLSSATDGY